MALGLLALEAAARLTQQFWGGRKEAGEQLHYIEYDPLLGWRKRPGARVRYRRREYTADVAINSHGLRDVERDYPAPPGTLRVLALGDSFVEGYSVPFEECVSRVLEKTLASRGCRAQVLNGGTLGYSTDQEYLFYQSEGAKHSPQIVVLFFYYNDVIYNDRPEFFGAPKPMLERMDGHLGLREFPVRHREAPRLGRHSRRRHEPPPPGRSALLSWVRDRLWLGAPSVHDWLARWGLWSPMPKMPIRTEMRVYQRQPPPQVEHAWLTTSSILEALAKEAESHGARLLTVGVPARFEVDDASWRVEQALHDLDEADWDRGQVQRRLVDAGRSAGFPVLDLTASLRAGSHFWAPAYHKYDGHWTAVGHAIAAREVAGFLTQRGWLAGCAASSK